MTLAQSFSQCIVLIPMYQLTIHNYNIAQILVDVILIQSFIPSPRRIHLTLHGYSTYLRSHVYIRNNRTYKRINNILNL